MKLINRTLIAVAFATSLIAPATAQPPGRGGNNRSDDVDGFVAKMMAFNTKKDGKLTRDEITDARLLRLFDRADTNKDGVVTRDELIALYQRESVGGGGPGGPGGPGGGPGGRGRGGPPQPGQVLPTNMQDQLNLTDAQKKQIADLQKEIDGRLGKILTAEQKAQMQEMRNRGPGGGRDGPGGGGPPPTR
jgi:hypothetical protein